MPYHTFHLRNHLFNQDVCFSLIYKTLVSWFVYVRVVLLKCVGFFFIIVYSYKTVKNEDKKILTTSQSSLSFLNLVFNNNNAVINNSMPSFCL